MLMRVTGDFGKLKAWEALLKNGNVLMRVVRDMLMQEMLALVDQGFDRQADPYGRPWAPKLVNDGRPILSGRTGALRSGFSVRAKRDKSFEIRNSARSPRRFPYMAAHQDPRKSGRKQRMTVPNGSRGLPVAWKREMEDAAHQVMTEYFDARAGSRKPRTPKPRASSGGAAGSFGRKRRARKLAKRAHSLINVRRLLRTVRNLGALHLLMSGNGKRA